MERQGLPELTPLCEIAKKFSTDKGGWHLQAGDTCHNYTPTYYNLFKGRQDKVKNVLEIGINYGCSLRMWEEFFPNARIIGLDCNASTMVNEGRIQSFIADQNSEESLKYALAQAGWPRFDLIVDDGSHEPEHQILSAGVLLPFLAKGGFYIIEDIHYDCNPAPMMSHIKDINSYSWYGAQCGVGLGKARCHPQCPRCGGVEGEQLVVVSHG